MTKDKSSASFEEVLSYVIDFCNLHGHVVKTFDSTLAPQRICFPLPLFSPATTLMLIQQPSRVSFRIQWSAKFRRSTKELRLALLIDQSTLGHFFCCYAVESWILTVNAINGSHEVEGALPLEIVTTNVSNISATFKFPFGCPVTSTKTEDSDHHYSPNSEIAIVVDSSRRPSMASSRCPSSQDAAARSRLCSSFVRHSGIQRGKLLISGKINYDKR